MKNKQNAILFLGNIISTYCMVFLHYFQPTSQALLHNFHSPDVWCYPHLWCFLGCFVADVRTNKRTVTLCAVLCSCVNLSSRCSVRPPVYLKCSNVGFSKPAKFKSDTAGGVKASWFQKNASKRTLVKTISFRWVCIFGEADLSCVEKLW